MRARGLGRQGQGLGYDRARDSRVRPRVRAGAPHVGECAAAVEAAQQGVTQRRQRQREGRALPLGAHGRPRHLLAGSRTHLRARVTNSTHLRARVTNSTHLRARVTNSTHLLLANHILLLLLTCVLTCSSVRTSRLRPACAPTACGVMLGAEARAGPSSFGVGWVVGRGQGAGQGQDYGWG